MRILRQFDQLTVNLDESLFNKDIRCLVLCWLVADLLFLWVLFCGFSLFFGLRNYIIDGIGEVETTVNSVAFWFRGLYKLFFIFFFTFRVTLALRIIVGQHFFEEVIHPFFYWSRSITINFILIGFELLVGLVQYFRVFLFFIWWMFLRKRHFAATQYYILIKTLKLFAVGLRIAIFKLEDVSVV